MEEKLFGFKVGYEADYGGQYLVIYKDSLEEMNLINFQVEMAAHNQIPGFIKLELRERDSKSKLYYNISGLKTLSSYLKGRETSKAEFSALVSQIISIVIEGRKYLLNDNSYIMNEHFMYIEPETHQLFLVYIPAVINNECVKSFKGLVKKLILDYAKIRTNDNFVQKLLSLLKSETDNLKDLRKHIESLADSEIIQDLKPSKDDLDHGSFPLDKSDTGEKNSRKKAVIAIVSASAFIIAIFFTGQYIEGLRGLLKQYQYLQAGALIFIITILAYFWKPMPGSKSLKSHEKDIENRSGKTVPCEETVLLRPDINENVLGTTSCPLLKAVNSKDAIYINKTNLTIGRNKESCDYVIDNKSIGRVHAKIKIIDNFYYIVDLESKNGTFINGNQLISNEEYQLTFGDKVVIADMEFCFINQLNKG